MLFQNDKDLEFFKSILFFGLVFYYLNDMDNKAFKDFIVISVISFAVLYLSYIIYNIIKGNIYKLKEYFKKIEDENIKKVNQKNE